MVWGNNGKTHGARLHNLPNPAARVLTFSRYDTRADYLIERLGWKKTGLPKRGSKSCSGLLVVGVVLVMEVVLVVGIVLV